MIGLRFSLTSAPVGQRRFVVPRAEADRRMILSGLVAGVAGVAGGPARANQVTPVDLFDDRKRTAESTGWDIIDEARDQSLSINVRDGIEQYRTDMAATKARFTESAKRIRKDVGMYINKKYWTDAANELHHQVGNMRADMRTITSAMPSKSQRKEGQAKARSLIESIEDLNYALERRELSRAPALYAKVNDELSAFSKYAMG